MNGVLYSAVTNKGIFTVLAMAAHVMSGSSVMPFQLPSRHMILPFPMRFKDKPTSTAPQGPRSKEWKRE